MGTTSEDSAARSYWRSGAALGLYFATAKLLIHFFSNGFFAYGHMRDEFYYLAQGEHLDWGYVDAAPLAALFARVSRALLGDSLFALRLLPAVAGAVKVLLTGWMVRELGGKRFAVVLACLCVLVAPAYLGIDNVYSMNAFEPLFWMGCAYCVIRAVKSEESRYWLWFGLWAGVGLENKHSMLFFGLALLVGLLLTSARRFFADRWLWVGAAVSFFLFLPNLIWQYQHDWATLELLRDVQRSGKNVFYSPLGYMGQQILLLQPVTAVVWMAGLWFFFFDREGSRYRVLGVAYTCLLVVGVAYTCLLVVMVALRGKTYYLLPAYPMLFAGGAVWWEKVLSSRRALRWLQVALPVLVVMGGIVAAPFALPILPVESYLSYQRALHFKPPKTEVHHTGTLPLHFADMFGWREMVETVARVYHTLPPDERAKTAIVARNYGQAGAIDFFWIALRFTEGDQSAPELLLMGSR